MQQHRDSSDVIVGASKMSSHHNTDSKVSKKNIFAPNDGSSVQHADIDSPGKKKPEFIQMEKMDT